MYIEKVVGTSFAHINRDRIRPLSVEVDDGTEVATVRGVILPEPDNPYDPQAKRVVCEGVDDKAIAVGYLSKNGYLYTVINQPTSALIMATHYNNPTLSDSYAVKVNIPR